MSPTTRPTLTALCCVAAWCATGCATDSGSPPGSARTASAPAAAALFSLPGPSSWQGTLPCADCEGIATTLTLEPDGTFHRQGAYLGTGGGGDTILAEFGRWVLQPASSRVRLTSSAEAPPYYAVGADGALTQLDLEGQPIAGSLDYRLLPIAASPPLAHPARVVVGFSYHADAALAVECRSGLAWPVDMSGGYLALERAYLASGRTGSQPLVVRLRVHLDKRPAMEGDGTAGALVVDSLLEVNAEDGCAALRQQDQIAAGIWQLVAMDDGTGAPLDIPAEPRATFAWDRTEGRIAGNSGCNRYAASGALRGTTLAVGPAMGTKMACLSDQATVLETRFLEVLGASPSLAVVRDTLVWAAGPREVARFVRE